MYTDPSARSCAIRKACYRNWCVPSARKIICGDYVHSSNTCHCFTGTIHRGVLPQYPNITADTLKALSLCTNLRSMTWVDDSSTTFASLIISFLNVLRSLPLRELTIRTHSDLGEQVWAELITLRKISIWCMEGPPRVLQGWSEPLGNTLTHLELGVSVFSYPCSECACSSPSLSPSSPLLSCYSGPDNRDVRASHQPSSFQFSRNSLFSKTYD